ncbi:hypothetical protein PVAP13_3NG295300 [Panicum virgatum]|uniref:Uncharacterized protein n=1 Tax=Panicum virgatum TaxID=38727 RepID=A0A8T0UD55_PANVG|nr:hypothetical protein PVAP13_3NG295300 [Panicum virgatum]
MAASSLAHGRRPPRGPLRGPCSSAGRRARGLLLRRRWMGTELEAARIWSARSSRGPDAERKEGGETQRGSSSTRPRSLAGGGSRGGAHPNSLPLFPMNHRVAGQPWPRRPHARVAMLPLGCPHRPPTSPAAHPARAAAPPTRTAAAAARRGRALAEPHARLSSRAARPAWGEGGVASALGLPHRPPLPGMARVERETEESRGGENERGECRGRENEGRRK